MSEIDLKSFPGGAAAVVFGATGGVGAALKKALEGSGAFERVIGLSRSGDPSLDLTDEASIAAAAQTIADAGAQPRLMIDATGFLHDARFKPQRSLKELDAAHLAHDFAVNATGPALLMKHFLPLAPRGGKSVFATLSARVGSIGDNGLGGWHSYRASKAALNQFVRTTAIEHRRRWKEAIVVAMHPGTVDTDLSAPFAKSGLNVRPPAEAARDILTVIDSLQSGDTGGFFDYRGDRLPW